MMRKGKATSLEVALRAGVSQPTVSRALRGSTTVNEATRKRIQAIADELNYKVDKNASNLRAQHTDTLALLFFEDPTLDDSLINPFFLSMLGSITRACAIHGYDLLISFQQLTDNWLADYQDSKKADGLILLGYGDYIEYLKKLEQLVAQGTRFVRWGAVLSGQPGISIGCDNFDGGRCATQHLLDIGRRKIAFLGHASEHYPEFLERHRGYCNRLTEYGIAREDRRHVDAVSTERSGYDAAEELLARGVEFDAVFCASDLIAIGAMQSLRKRGVRIPEDVAVTGFDDVSSASFANPPLTTVQQDTKLAGQLLVEALLALIHDQPIDSQTMPVKLVVRSSTAG